MEVLALRSTSILIVEVAAEIRSSVGPASNNLPLISEVVLQVDIRKLPRIKVTATREASHRVRVS